MKRENMGKDNTKEPDGTQGDSATAEFAKQRDRHYEENRAENLTAGREEERALGKWVLTLSSGALVFSWTLVNDIGSPGTTKGNMLLAFAWGLLILAIMCGIFSMYASIRAHRAFVEIADSVWDELTKDPQTDYYSRVTKEEDKCAWLKCIRWSSGAAPVCLLVGVILLCIFAYRNL